MAELVCPVPSNENAERIVREAWALFQERLSRASVAELCRRCGITKPTLYYYFHDKETLFVHVILRQLRGYRGILGGRSAARPAHRARRRHADQLCDGHRRDDARHGARQGPGPPGDGLPGVSAGGVRSPRGRFGSRSAGRRDRSRRSSTRWAYLGLVNTFVGKSERLATPPEVIAQQLVALFFDGVHTEAQSR